MMRSHLLCAALLVALSGASSAQSHNLGEYPVVRTPASTGVEKYHYSRDGGVVTAKGLGKEDRLIVTLTISWPGDMTTRIHCVTPEGRDVQASFHLETGFFELLDNETGKIVTLQPNAETGEWKLGGGSESARAFVQREQPILNLIAYGYTDVVFNLNLMPERSLTNQGQTRPSGAEPTTCQWTPCNGPSALGTALHLELAGCCRSAKNDADIQCSNVYCARCCMTMTCSALCIFDETFCSCSVEGRACGATQEVPCEEWPPECT